MENKILIKQNQQEWLNKYEEELIRAELNLCKLLSIWETSKSKKKSKVIEQKEILPNGSFKIKRMTIGGRHKAGVFTIKKHLKTFLALIKIYEDAGKPEKISFGVHQLAETLNLKWGRTTYNYLKEALEDLRTIPITFENIFYNKKTGETEESLDFFTWLDDLKIYGKLKDRQPNLTISTYSFNKYIRQNILKGYTKPLFLTTITNFKTEIAILLYNHLDLVMADKSCYERTLKNLIEVDFRLGGKYKYAGNRKYLFEKPLKELKGVKLTTGILTNIHLERTKDGKDYKIVCKKSLPSLAVNEQGNLDKTTKTQAQEIVKYFHKNLNPEKHHQSTQKEIKQTQELLDKYSKEEVKHIIDYAIKQAKKTNFEMCYFGAVLNYVEDAMGYVKEQKESRLKEQYNQYLINELDEYLKKIDKQILEKELEDYEDVFYEKYPFYEQYRGSEKMEPYIERDYKKEKGKKIGLLSFEEWKKGQKTAT